MKSVLAEEPWKYDSKVVPIPWRENEEDIIIKKISSSGLTIGFYTDDGVVSVRKNKMHLWHHLTR
jgi:amidase